MGWKRTSKLNPLDRGAERDLQITQEFVTLLVAAVLRSTRTPLWWEI